MTDEDMALAAFDALGGAANQSMAVIMEVRKRFNVSDAEATRIVDSAIKSDALTMNSMGSIRKGPGSTSSPPAP